MDGRAQVTASRRPTPSRARPASSPAHTLRRLQLPAASPSAGQGRRRGAMRSAQHASSLLAGRDAAPYVGWRARGGVSHRPPVVGCALRQRGTEERGGEIAREEMSLTGSGWGRGVRGRCMTCDGEGTAALFQTCGRCSLRLAGGCRCLSPCWSTP
jgi:hypothetical protein